VLRSLLPSSILVCTDDFTIHNVIMCLEVTICGWLTARRPWMMEEEGIDTCMMLNVYFSISVRMFF
jgi:hypothetical protein